MRILYLHQHFTTPQGASGTRSYEMSQKLIRRGHQVTMVCGSFGAGKTGLTAKFESGRREGEVDGIKVIEFHLPYSNKDGFLKRIFTFLKFSFLNVKVVLSKDYDLLIATSTPLTVAIPALIAKWFRGKKYVFEVRDLWPELPKEMGVIRNPVILKLMSWLETLAYRNSSACIGLSPGIQKGIELKAQHNKPVTMIPNGCDTHLFSPEGRGVSKNELGFDDEDFVALFAGTHGLANGLDKLLDVAIELKNRKITNIKLLLIGDGKLKSQLQEKALEEGLQDIIVFKDPVSKTELTRIMYATDAGLMVLANVPAFYYGTSPNKFFDYIASGLPVVNNYPGWLAEVIQEHNIGVAVPPEDPQRFVEALINLRMDSGLQNMKKRARSLAEDKFSREKLSEQFVDFIESVS